MDKNIHSETPHPDFVALVEKARKNKSRTLHTDEELVLLACHEISRTFTHEERNYNS